MLGRPQPTLRSPVKIKSDGQLGLTPDRTHEIAEGMMALLMARMTQEGGRYEAGVVREGFVPLTSSWAEAFLNEGGHAVVGIYADAPERLAARLRAEGKVV